MSNPFLPLTHHSRIIKCPDCNGHGYTYTLPIGDRWCQRCEGYGEINLIEEWFPIIRPFRWGCNHILDQHVSLTKMRVLRSKEEQG